MGHKHSVGPRHKYDMVELPRDRVAIVTGASAGIGYETAKNLAIMGAKVILACRNEEKTRKAMSRMREEYEHYKSVFSDSAKHEELQLYYMHLDLASLQSTHTFVQQFLAMGWPLHILICNAGIAVNNISITEDHHETMFQTNYLSHFLIIEHLLPVLETSGPDVRIILVSSIGHYNAHFNRDDIENLTLKKDINLSLYGTTKLYQVMQMYKLAEKLKQKNITNIGVFALHPGYVQTEIARDLRPLLKVLNKIGSSLKIATDSVKGAYTTLYCAVSPDLKGQCGYYNNCRPERCSGKARNKALQDIVWDYTFKCLQDHLPKHSESVNNNNSSSSEQTTQLMATAALTAADVQPNQL
ncbi:unnamed protein product [Owenia fusiformis]|uniref:Uncharacterized protein n=1 Tax=Owenia fusiformis TaxID=6347 RepID=A0A8J1XV88_OWEFU|nr:unnamed protein product [Owenia fusiformis]